MGADGHIQIWKDSEVRAEFPDCDYLFKKLPFHYLDELDGVQYHHVYWGDNFVTYWDDPDDWYLPHHKQWDRNTNKWIPLTEQQESENKQLIARLSLFVDWLSDNGTHWEVWT